MVSRRMLGIARGDLALVPGLILVLGITLGSMACRVQPPAPPDPEAELIAEGRRLFFNEPFAGNGRTCGTCHRTEDNFGLSPAFIATLPPEDPLFAAEFVPALSENFENPRLMREFGLIIENLDGFDDLAEVFTLRGVPHILGLRTSVASPQGPRTGWSGDGAPGDGSLRAFSTGAVIQHFPLTLGRVPGTDFRLPTAAELDALEAFMLSVGRQEDLQLPLPLKGTVVQRGQVVFLDDGLGKCNICHRNAGANASLGGQDLGNANFDTGVEDLTDQPARLTGERVPVDDGFGIPGDGTFNTPPLVEAADTGPFFHNNSVETIEGAVAFYNSDAFNDSPAGQFLAARDPNGVGIRLDTTQVVAVAAFLRVINALENIRESLELLEESLAPGASEHRPGGSALDQALAEIEDARQVLAGGGLHPQAVMDLDRALRLGERAAKAYFSRKRLIRETQQALRAAREDLIEVAA